VVDHRGGGISTSEGQAYAMMRAAWIGDRRSFDRVREWTLWNLQGGSLAALPAWKWGPRPDGSWGILDENPASDADLWMAYALFTAAERWHEPDYRVQAMALLSRIWDEEVGELDGRPVLLPGPWARGGDPLRLNPSYFLTFAWRFFAQVDPDHPWTALVDHSYELLAVATEGGRLPPDWLYIDRATGAPTTPPQGLEEGDRYGFEAYRVPWNLAADVWWYDDARARALLGGLSPMMTTWRRDGRIPAVMDSTGAAVVEWETLGLYGAMLPAAEILHPSDAAALYASELEEMRECWGWGEPDDYYSQNWVWFGLALWSRLARATEPWPSGSGSGP